MGLRHLSALKDAAAAPCLCRGPGSGKSGYPARINWLAGFPAWLL